MAARALPVAAMPQPVHRRHMVLVADDLDFVAGAQLGHQRQDGAVDLGADGGVANVGMQRIGEIDRRGAARQGNQPAARGKAEDLVLEQFELGIFEEILGRIAGGQVLDGRAQRAIGLALVLDAAEIGRGAFLVERVGGDAVFGDAMHLLGADLQLGALPAGTPTMVVWMELVVVVLGDRDVVLEAARHDLPVGVDDRRARAIAFLDRVGTMTRKPIMSESCSSAIDLRSILVKIETRATSPAPRRERSMPSAFEAFAELGLDGGDGLGDTRPSSRRGGR